MLVCLVIWANGVWGGVKYYNHSFTNFKSRNSVRAPFVYPALTPISEFMAVTCLKIELYKNNSNNNKGDEDNSMLSLWPYISIISACQYKWCSK